MKILKKVKIISLVIIIILGVSGCMKSRSERIKDEILQHLNEKYDVTFLPISLEQRGMGGVGNSYDEFRCYAEGDDPKTDYAIVYRFTEDDGSIGYEDTYFGIKIREEVEKYVTDICHEFAKDIIVYTGAYSDFEDKYDKNATFEEALSNGDIRCFIRIGILYQNESETEIVHTNEMIQKKFENENLRGTFQIYYVDYDTFKSIERDNCLDIARKRRVEYFSFAL